MIGRQKGGGGGEFGVAFTIPDSFNCEQAKKSERAPLGNEFDAPSARSGSARDAVAHTIRFQAEDKSAFAAITGSLKFICFNLLPIFVKLVSDDG